MSTLLHEGWGEVNLYITPQANGILRLALRLTQDGPQVWLIPRPAHTLGYTEIIKFGNGKRMVILYVCGINIDVTEDVVEAFDPWYSILLAGIVHFLGIPREPALAPMVRCFSDEDIQRLRDCYVRRAVQAESS